MTFQPRVDDQLLIDGTSYRIVEHPEVPGRPYAQEGRQGIVYQLKGPDGFRALKAFKPMYRVPALVSLADRLERCAELPGLQVCQRTVLSANRHADLLKDHTDLTYAVLMPWVEGPTWMNVVLLKRPLSPEQSLALARALGRVLTTMEERNLAHCDLSSQNLMVPALAERVSVSRGLRPDASPGAIQVASFGMALVDVEGMYAPGLDRPRDIISGSAGYAHRSLGEGVWAPEADRFAGAVLLAEILSWHDDRVREMAHGDSYFELAETQQYCERLRLLREVLQLYGNRVVTLFEQAWFSNKLIECPTFGEWAVTLPQAWPVVVAPPVAGRATPSRAPVQRAATRPRPWVWIALALVALVALAAVIVALLMHALKPGALPVPRPTPSATRAATLTPTARPTALPTSTVTPRPTPTVARASPQPTVAGRIAPLAVRSVELGRSGYRKLNLDGLSYAGGKLTLWGDVQMPEGRFPDQFWLVSWVGDDVISRYNLDPTDGKIKWFPVTGEYRKEDAQGALATWNPTENTRCLVWIQIEAKAGKIAEKIMLQFDLGKLLPGCVK